MGKLFGTDGIRGEANQYPMTAEMAVKVGRAIAGVLIPEESRKTSKIIIGKDTRISRHMLEYALASGICSMGVDVELTGILPTPAIAYLTAKTSTAAGIVISASHNPYYDNGIKIFNNDGFKLPDAVEKEIEELVLSDKIESLSESIQETGSVFHMVDAQERYIAFLKQIVPGEMPFEGLNIVMDCANGATYKVAPQVFSELGARVESFSSLPDGKNINFECGSEHPEMLIQKVLMHEADVGLAFDGDGDRLVVIDEKGGKITGDKFLAICAKYLKETGKLTNNMVISTVMSNLGLKNALAQMDIEHVASKVGDRYVMEEMIANKAILGGEDSGHLIFLDHHTTGDGIFAALRLITVLKQSDQPLSALSSIMAYLPQALINVDVKQKPEISGVPQLTAVIRAVEDKLGDQGRVLVRYSGTQPMCRVMVEGPTVEETNRFCDEIAQVVKATLG